ncbi:hypothetical protein GCM10022393_01200 [Aquimarina addita]|uniref:Uncharacterized protein n=1 Tax=Aquimarina addita TaxID=870485 RepID=A0ABP7X7L0_9FLAO
MGLDLSLTAIPKEGTTILEKAKRRQNSEYSTIIFSLHRAFDTNFNDFGHSEWIEFKKDAQNLAKHYPNKKFENKYYLDTNRTYEVFDYLIAKKLHPNRNFKETPPFFYDGILCDFSQSGQGHYLMLWDYKIIQKKNDILNRFDFEQYYEMYNLQNMLDEGVYKIHQIAANTQELKSIFNQIKKFLKNALELEGYVIVFKI